MIPSGPAARRTRMKLSILCAAAVLAVMGPAAPAAAQALAAGMDSVRTLMPVGTFSVDVMDVAPSPRLNELSRRMQASVRADSAWFMAAIRRAEPGQPLPYDPRLG